MKVRIIREYPMDLPEVDSFLMEYQWRSYTADYTLGISEPVTLYIWPKSSHLYKKNIEGGLG